MVLEAVVILRIQVSLAYAAASLYFCHLLSQGNCSRVMLPLSKKSPNISTFPLAHFILRLRLEQLRPAVYRQKNICGLEAK